MDPSCDGGETWGPVWPDNVHETGVSPGGQSWIPHRGRRSESGRANSKKDLVTGLIRGFCALHATATTRAWRRRASPNVDAGPPLRRSSISGLRALSSTPAHALGAPMDRNGERRLKLRDDALSGARIAACSRRDQPLSSVFVPSTSIICRSVPPSPARISIRRGLASGATGIWIVSTPCS
jgi:hypothetical protein